MTVTFQSIQMCVSQSTSLISTILICQTRVMANKIDGYRGVCPCALVDIQLDLCENNVAQSCRTAYDTIILIIHSANLDRASTSSLSCCGSTLLWKSCVSLWPLLIISDFHTEIEWHIIRFVRSLMPRMKLVIPEVDSALKADQKR